MGYNTHGRSDLLQFKDTQKKEPVFLQHKRKAKQKVTVYSTTEICGLCDAAGIFVR